MAIISDCIWANAEQTAAWWTDENGHRVHRLNVQADRDFIAWSTEGNAPETFVPLPPRAPKLDAPTLAAALVSAGTLTQAQIDAAIGKSAT